MSRGKDSHNHLQEPEVGTSYSPSGEILTETPPGNCEVCRKIIATFIVPDLVPGRRIHESGWEPIYLGNSVQVLDSSMCDEHPRFLRSICEAESRHWTRRTDLENMYPDFFQAYQTLSANSQLEWRLQRWSQSDDLVGAATLETGNVDRTFRLPVKLYAIRLPDFRNQYAKGRRIDPMWHCIDQLREWKTECLLKHKVCGRGLSLTEGFVASFSPAWLIDCNSWRIVPGRGKGPYFTLSYVWGNSNTLTAMEGNVWNLQQDNALRSPGIAQKLPDTIRDAIGLTAALRERYLWVDALCIVQDQHETKHQQIMQMPQIYANALVTIVAKADGAWHGLRGICGISQPRNRMQGVFNLNTQLTCVSLTWNSYQGKWDTRGWCFQEEVFSRRRLIFNNGRVRWECRQARCHEDRDDHDDLQHEREIRGKEQPLDAHDIFTIKPTNMHRLKSTINRFNQRHFTFECDAYHAFSGILSSISSAFAGGFISGHPALFFHECLLWHPAEPSKRRCGKETLSGPGKTTTPELPSWAWCGWEGEMSHESWSECDPWSIDTYRYYKGESVEPLFMWFFTNPGCETYSPIHSSYNAYRHWYFDSCDTPCPRGWERHLFRDGPRHNLELGTIKCYYTNTSLPGDQLLFPTPMPEPEFALVRPCLVQLIRCRTRRAQLWAGHRIIRMKTPQHDVYVYNRKCKVIGWVTVNSSDSVIEAMLGYNLELVEVSKGYRNRYDRDFLCNCGRLRSECGDSCNPYIFHRPREPGLFDELTKHWYNVMWIEWHNGIAYRKGLGKVYAEWVGSSGSRVDRSHFGLISITDQLASVWEAAVYFMLDHDARALACLVVVSTHMTLQLRSAPSHSNQSTVFGPRTDSVFSHLAWRYSVDCELDTSVRKRTAILTWAEMCRHSETF